MKGKSIPVKVKAVTKNKFFNKILPVGFETILHVRLRDDDHTYTTRWTDPTGEVHEEHHTIPKGTYHGYTFLGADGKEYSNFNVEMIVGEYRPIDQIFDKV